MTAQEILSGDIENKSVTIPVTEEEVHIGKQVIETGKINISKTVNEQTEKVNVVVKHEEVEVERVAINQYVETPPEPIRSAPVRSTRERPRSS